MHIYMFMCMHIHVRHVLLFCWLQIEGNVEWHPLLNIVNSSLCLSHIKPKIKTVKSRTYLPVSEISKSSSTFSATTISSNIIWLHNICKIYFLVPNLVAFISKREKKFCFFDYHLLTCIVRKMVLMCLMQHINHQIARLVSHLINCFSKWMFTL